MIWNLAGPGETCQCCASLAAPHSGPGFSPPPPSPAPPQAASWLIKPMMKGSLNNRGAFLLFARKPRPHRKKTLFSNKFRSLKITQVVFSVAHFCCFPISLFSPTVHAVILLHCVLCAHVCVCMRVCISVGVNCVVEVLQQHLGSTQVGASLRDSWQVPSP